MKNTKMIAKMFTVMLFIAVSLTTSNVSAQTKTKKAMMKDCCMMKDGKMMHMKDGKMMTMDKDMKMKNGTTCMVNGECVMKDGKKMKMKEGDCMDMNGKMDKCDMMKTKKHTMSMTYTCPMHPEVSSDKQGKCPKCGMDLIVKK